MAGNKPISEQEIDQILKSVERAESPERGRRSDAMSWEAAVEIGVPRPGGYAARRKTWADEDF